MKGCLHFIMKFNPIDLLSIPNILSYIRLILIPVFVNIYNTAKTPEDLKLAAAIIVASGLTDMLDGFIARRFHMITDIGKLIDPMADKLTQLAVLYCLTSRYDKMWILVGLCIIKEGYMAGKMVFTYKRHHKRLDGASYWGKACTALLYLTMFILIVFVNIPAVAADILIYVCALMMITTLYQYVQLYKTL